MAILGGLIPDSQPGVQILCLSLSPLPPPLVCRCASFATGLGPACQPPSSNAFGARVGVCMQQCVCVGG